MEKSNKISLKEVIQATYNELRTINVPASIGPDAMMNLSIPIARAMQNLQACLDAIHQMENSQPVPEAPEAEEETNEA